MLPQDSSSGNPRSAPAATPAFPFALSPTLGPLLETPLLESSFLSPLEPAFFSPVDSESSEWSDASSQATVSLQKPRKAWSLDSSIVGGSGSGTNFAKATTSEQQEDEWKAFFRGLEQFQRNEALEGRKQNGLARLHPTLHQLPGVRREADTEMSHEGIGNLRMTGQEDQLLADDVHLALGGALFSSSNPMQIYSAPPSPGATTRNLTTVLSPEDYRDVAMTCPNSPTLPPVEENLLLDLSQIGGERKICRSRVPLDAPIEPRKYVIPSTTSRKAVTLSTVKAMTSALKKAQIKPPTGLSLQPEVTFKKVEEARESDIVVDHLLLEFSSGSTSTFSSGVTSKITSGTVTPNSEECSPLLPLFGLPEEPTSPGVAGGLVETVLKRRAANTLSARKSRERKRKELRELWDTVEKQGQEMTQLRSDLRAKETEIRKVKDELRQRSKDGSFIPTPDSNDVGMEVAGEGDIPIDPGSTSTGTWWEQQRYRTAP